MNEKESGFLLKMLHPDYWTEAISSKINEAAVNNSEIARNISAGVTGLLRLPIALKNRLNARITNIAPWWTREKVESPKNTWTIDKSNHLARYYDLNGKLVITSPAGTGLVKGNKTKSGDNKTPNGTFRLGSPEKGENKKGGEMSFGPYFYRTNHNGGKSGIGLHGTGNPVFNGMDISHGCIRIDNSAIKKFYEIAPNKGTGTKIVIYEKSGGKLKNRNIIVVGSKN